MERRAAAARTSAAQPRWNPSDRGGPARRTSVWARGAALACVTATRQELAAEAAQPSLMSKGLDARLGEKRRAAPPGRSSGPAGKNAGSAPAIGRA
jgi:hypothetical protein